MNSALAVFVGLVFTIAATTLAEHFLTAPSSYIEWAIHLVYHLLFDVGGCAVAARLAARQPMRSAMILGALLLVLASIWLVQSWPDAAVPQWHPTLLVLLALPAAWMGGWLGRRSDRLA